MKTLVVKIMGVFLLILGIFFCCFWNLLSSSFPLFRTLIEKDVSIPPETFRKHVDCSLTYINQALKQLSRLFLVEDLVDSLKVRAYLATN